MILEALTQHYDRLADDSGSGIAAYGYSRQKIAFCVVINPDGSLHAIEPMIDESSGRPRPVELVVPGQSKPSGSGINPCLLWDNPAYLLGYVPEDAERKVVDRAGQSFTALRDLHLGLKQQIDDPHFDAVCTFLTDWDVSQLTDETQREPLERSGFGVFRLRGAGEFAHQRAAVQSYWQSQLHAGVDEAEGGGHGFCLLTGRRAPIARLHEPKIKGVKDAQSSGATLVSFNDPAYESHGKSQGLNAPVSEAAAFKYATALNHLLADPKHRVQLGDTTCVFWTDRPETGAPYALAELLGESWAGVSGDNEEAETRSDLSDFLNRFRRGKDAPRAADLEHADAPFYVLGLSPNAARVSVRFWIRCTVRELADRLGGHVHRVAIYDSRQQQTVYPALRELLRETGREAKDIPPQLAGELTRSLLTDSPYPTALPLNILRRIKADQANDKHDTVNPSRAAGLKAWLTRNRDLELSVALDSKRTDPPYLLGRLFAAYEKVQQESSGGTLNRTIRDSYLSSASATPGAVFPRLYRLSQHHFNKLRLESPGLAVNRERLIGMICQGLAEFPRQLSLQDQGLFAIGYYHQTQDFYTKHAPEVDPVASQTSEDQ